MINLDSFPLCKYPAKYEFSENKNFKLVKCDDCKDFIISSDAEEVLIKEVVKRANYRSVSQMLSDDKMLLIFLNEDQASYNIVNKEIWLSQKTQI